MIANLLTALPALLFRASARAPSIGAWLRSRRPAPTCGNWRYFTRHFDGTFCDRRAIWRLSTDQKCNIGEVKS